MRSHSSTWRRRPREHCSPPRLSPGTAAPTGSCVTLRRPAHSSRLTSLGCAAVTSARQRSPLRHAAVPVDAHCVKTSLHIAAGIRGDPTAGRRSRTEDGTPWLTPSAGSWRSPDRASVYRAGTRQWASGAQTDSLFAWTHAQLGPDIDIAPRTGRSTGDSPGKGLLDHGTAPCPRSTKAWSSGRSG